MNDGAQAADRFKLKGKKLKEVKLIEQKLIEQKLIEQELIEQKLIEQKLNTEKMNDQQTVDQGNVFHPEITMITCEKNWLESTAISQLHGVAKLPGVRRVVGLPDLHAGKTPVGMALETQGILYPHLIGGDIGCGMGLFDTGIDTGKYHDKRWGSRLNYIRALSDIETLNPYHNPSDGPSGDPSEDPSDDPSDGPSDNPSYDPSHDPCPIPDPGTLGSGNHFAEFQRVEEVLDPETFAELNLQTNRIALLVHSGSRGYGQEIFRWVLRQVEEKTEGDKASINLAAARTHTGASCKRTLVGFNENSPEAREYLTKHDNALLWAYRNRGMVAGKLTDCLGYDPEPKRLVDVCHNFLEKRETVWIHRKGAVSAEQGLVLLPGSRGSLTYIVKPAEDTERALYSLSHGAGRKWARSLCKSRIKNKYDKDSIRRTKFKSRVVCHDTDLLFQEAPEAYKNIEHILTALLEHGLITIVASLRPMLTYKG
jgi:release factor H-coupled RctB family protein